MKYLAPLAILILALYGLSSSGGNILSLVPIVLALVIVVGTASLVMRLLFGSLFR